MSLFNFPTERYIYKQYGIEETKIHGCIGLQEIAGLETLYLADNVHLMPGDKIVREESGEQYIVRGYDLPFFSLCGRCFIEKIN